MYIEETGAGDGDIKITVAGEDYTAEANYDLDGDGVDETVTVMTDDGFVAYVDDNADGQADLTQTVSDEGTVLSQARFDEASGHWVSEAPQQHPPVEHHDPAASMVVDTPNGEQQVGPATEDTNNDGRADTAIVATDSGTLLVTDVDGDGSADQLVQVENSGEVTISHHTGEGQWSVAEEGRIDEHGQYAPRPVDPFIGGGRTDDAAWTFDEEPGSSPQHGAGFQQAADSDSVWG